MSLPADIDPSLIERHPHLCVVFGAGTASQTGMRARELGATRALLVTDAGIVAAGHAGAVRGHLERAGVAVTLYDRAKENPTTACVEDCVAVARQAGVDFIIGLGGGSSMDTAKGTNFILTNGGQMQDYWGVGKAKLPMLPSIMIPTTAGTGSECQSFALIADNVTHQKMACGDPKAMAKVTILDPLLTLSQPARVSACTGIDALAHAVETAVTNKRNVISGKYSNAAFGLLASSLPRVLREPANLEARSRMLLGAALAGTAIEHSMLGAAHSAANPLTAHFDFIHGHAVGLMLPHVVRFNGELETACAHYQELLSAAGTAANGQAPAETLASLIESLLDTAELSRRLSACGVNEPAIEQLAAEAARQWTAGFNPRPIAAADFVRLYRAAL